MYFYLISFWSILNFFFSFKFLKNIHLELIEYFPMFCLITRNYVSKSFGKKCVLVAQSCPNSL